MFYTGNELMRVWAEWWQTFPEFNFLQFHCWCNFDSPPQLW
jgi:hypothetical protein